MQTLRGGPHSTRLDSYIDTLDWKGAHRLAEKIRRHWVRRDKVVQVRIECEKTPGTPRTPIYVIRSDMICGRPL